MFSLPRKFPDVWPFVIVLLGVFAFLTVVIGVWPQWRALIVFSFMLICPGMAFVRLLNVKDSLITITLAVALSLAIDAVVAMIQLYSQQWSPTFGLVILIAISFIGLLFLPNRMTLLPKDENDDSLAR